MSGMLHWHGVSVTLPWQWETGREKPWRCSAPPSPQQAVHVFLSVPAERQHL